MRPQNSRYDTRVESGGQHWALRNAGNTVGVVDEFKACAETDGMSCAPTINNPVFPGQVFSVDTPTRRVYRLSRLEGSPEKVVEISG